MKKLSFILLIGTLAVSINVNAQVAGVAINNDGSLPDPSAMLDVNSTTGGFLPPRVTGLQMLDISTPAMGLEVFNTSTETPCFYNGTQWKNLGGGNGVEHFVYYADSIGNVTIGNNSFYTWSISVPEITPNDIATITPSEDPSNGGNIIISSWIENGILFVKFSNISNSKNYPKLVDLKILIHRL